jgi:hypothetical protein
MSQEELVLDSSEDDAVLRIWALSEAPHELQQALEVEAMDADRWVAHIPPQLLDEPLIALLSMNSSPSHPLRTIRLKDGSALLSGGLSTCRCQQDDCSNAPVMAQLPHAAGLGKQELRGAIYGV